MNETGQGETLGIRLFFKAISVLVSLAVLTFITAGWLDYWQGWAYNGLNVFFLFITYIVLKDQKDLIKERAKPGKGMKRWDKAYHLVSALLVLIMFITSVLDGGRFSWSPAVPFIVNVLTCLVYTMGQLLLLWAKKANRFFSSVVRIQADRGQTVCSDGPYRFIRHPGYLGALIYTLAIPLLLGCYWGLIPAMLFMIPLAVRTHLEDKTLQHELAGYVDYVHKVPFRLIPHIW